MQQRRMQTQSLERRHLDLQFREQSQPPTKSQSQSQGQSQSQSQAWPEAQHQRMQREPQLQWQRQSESRAQARAEPPYGSVPASPPPPPAWPSAPAAPAALPSPPPIASASPAPMPVPMPAPSPAESKLRWNVWLARGDAPQQMAIAGRNYRIWLDLSKFEHFARQSVTASREIQEAVAKSKEEHLHLRVRAISLTQAVALEPDSRRDLKVEIPLRALRSDSSQVAASTLGDATRLRERLAARELVEVSIAVASFDASQQSACGQVAFSIWDESGIRPLDNVVFTFPIVESADSTPRFCGRSPVQGGLGSLLGAGESKKPFDAALHLFEYHDAGAQPRAVALLVDARRLQSTAESRASADRGVYVWFPERLPSRYVADELVASIKAARNGPDYSGVSKEIALRFFSDSRAPDEGRRALGALAEIARRNGSVRLLVRARTAENALFYPPLSLLGAQGGALGGAKLSAVFPLPREDHAQACVRRWQVAVPAVLDPVGVIDLTSDEMPPSMERIATLEALRSYLGASPAPAPMALKSAVAAAGAPAQPGGVEPSEGLMLLAHHDRGSLWFQGKGSPGPHLAIEENRRRFPPGSIAILGACSAVSTSEGNQMLLNKLNANGVDAILASPFPIEPSYAILLTRALLKTIADSYNKGLELSLEDVLERANKHILSSPDGRQFAEKGLEFILLGNEDIRLCK